MVHAMGPHQPRQIGTAGRRQAPEPAVDERIVEKHIEQAVSRHPQAETQQLRFSPETRPDEGDGRP
jgi:hypothetical protein